MILGWMLHALLVAALLGAAGLAAERALAARRLPLRWSWAAVMAASLLVPVWQWLTPEAAGAVATPGVGASVDPATFLAELQALAVRPSLARQAEPWLLAAWLTASAGMLLTVGVGLRRLARRARGWPTAYTEVGPVLVSDDFGPALLGVLDPRIVMPRWALGLEPERLAMIHLHEEEHRRAGDGAFLLAGVLAVALAPWNPLLWWQLGRLRAAVEVDCDARVLCRAVSPTAYGALLLEMGTRTPGLPLPVAALSKPPSLLERRLRMIVERVKRGGPLQAALAAVLAGGLLMAACETPTPVEAEGTVEATEATFQARGVPADAPSEVRLRPGLDLDGGMLKSTAEFFDARETAKAEFRAQEIVDGDEPGPLIIVDGVIVSGGMSAVQDLDTSTIDRIEVIKGEAARGLYGERAAQGVVNIYTKEAGGGGDAR